MTKSDLKTTMVFVTRGGEQRMVFRGKKRGEDAHAGVSGWGILDDYNEDLSHKTASHLDMVAVYEMTSNKGIHMFLKYGEYSDAMVRLIWALPSEDIDKTKKYTLEEVAQMVSDGEIGIVFGKDGAKLIRE